MKYVSTRTGLEATSAETVFRGLAPDGGLYLPSSVAKVDGIERADTLRKAEELVMGELHKVDEVAYIRFASVYRQFKDVAQFLAAITEIVKK